MRLGPFGLRLPLGLKRKLVLSDLIGILINKQ
jgi:hypothetical protein